MNRTISTDRVVNTETLKNLITWTQSPEGRPAHLKSLLSALTDDDLIVALSQFSEMDPVSRIAWAEYGNRRGFFKFEIRIVVVDGTLNLTFEANAEQVHHGVVREVKS